MASLGRSGVWRCLELGREGVSSLVSCLGGLGFGHSSRREQLLRVAALCG